VAYFLPDFLLIAYTLSFLPYSRCMPSQLILLHMIILILLGEEYKSRSFVLSKYSPQHPNLKHS
jgi:hypothetical protein